MARLRCWMFLAGMIAALPSAAAERFVEVQDRDEVSTVAGPLRVEKSTEEDDEFDIVLAGEVIGNNVGFAAGIIRAYPDARRARLILIEFDTGGSGCPLSYRLVEVKPEGATVTKEFGNCNALKTITREGDAWYFHVAGIRAPFDTWSYRGGILEKVRSRKNPKKR